MATNQSIDYNNEAKLGALHPTVTIAISIMICWARIDVEKGQHRSYHR